MNATRVMELTEDISDRAEQLRQDIVDERRDAPPYGEIFALRRSLDTLELELRNDGENVRGDAC